MLKYLLLIVLFGPPVAWLFSLPFRTADAVDGWVGKMLGLMVFAVEVAGIYFIGRIILSSITFTTA